jgi:Lrp/AsnC family transcriptional regulator, leucine-responsive regulatory protein
MPNSTLDAIDRRIIRTLQADGRLSNADLSQRVGLSASPCLRRVHRLEHEGYIEGYRAMLSRDQIGLGLTVFVGVKIAGHASAEATAFEQAVVAFPEIVACHMVSGEVDYLLEVVVPTWIITGASCSASCLSFRSSARSEATLLSKP